jgi:F-type H+-transporting ATPase subunit delta
MQAASRESLAAAVERLNGYAAGGEPEAVVATADELLAVARLLVREPRLRRALADPGRRADKRAELLLAVFGGKVSDDALGLVRALVEGRWSSANEMLEGVERLGVEALLAGADLAGELGEVEDELFRFGQVVAGDPALASALADSTATVQRRAGLVRELLEGKARPVTVRLAELALAGFGGRGFEASLTRLVEFTAERRDRTVAYVTAPLAPTDEEERRLVARLSEMYGRHVSLKITIDPRIIGGMSVRVGSDLYDGTISGRLAEARNAFAT